MSPATTNTPSKFDIFISHNRGMDGEHRDNHKRVTRLKEALRAANLITWINEEHDQEASSTPASSFHQSKLMGIKLSRTVLVCVTERYMDGVAGRMGMKDSCYKEFEYSARRKGLDHIIPVVMEKKLVNLEEWYGPLGLSLANSQYLDFTVDENLGECVRDIVKHFFISDNKQQKRKIINEEGTYIGAINDKGEKHGLFGCMKYSNGDYYEGPWINDKRHGDYGKLEYFQKSKSTTNNDQDKGGLQEQQPLAVYEGSFFNDQKHGTGKLTMRNGDVYEGGYVKNHKEGKGKFVAKNKSEIYEGDWKQGNRHGSGTLINSKGDYVGAFRNNVICGRGKMTYKDGRIYDGEWKDGKCFGKGEMREKNGNAYIGDWIDDYWHGHGVLTYITGCGYTGDFKNGMFDGFGKRKYENRSVYEGEYRKNKKHGKGMYTFGDGYQYYDGEWENNKRHGHGVRLYKNGDMYIGEFVHDKREGRGTIIFEKTGIEYHGRWLEDKRHGSGLCSLQNTKKVTMLEWTKETFVGKNVKHFKEEYVAGMLQSRKPVKGRRANLHWIPPPDKGSTVKFEEEQSLVTADTLQNSPRRSTRSWELRTESTSVLLASSAWQRANPLNYDGLVRRLEMMKDHGLPPMRVISAETLEKLGRIPRSTDDGGRYTEDALDVVIREGHDASNLPNAIILFFSHRWLRPNYCQEEGRDLIWGTDDRKNAMDNGYFVGYPDSSDNEKATALIHYTRWFKKQNRKTFNRAFVDISISNNTEIYFWIDFCCVDQTNPAPDMKALPAFAAVSAGILSYFSEGYENRAWCRVELTLAYSFMTTGNKVFALPYNFRYEGQKDIDEPPVRREIAVPDPLEGELTNEDDRAIVNTLREVASESTVFTCWRIFVNNSWRGAFWCLYWNICCCCQWCGFISWGMKRSVGTGKKRVKKIIPKPYDVN